MLNDDVIYYILGYLGTQDLVSFCLTSKKEWNNKHFWYTKFEGLPLRDRWARAINKEVVFPIINRYKWISKVDDLNTTISNFKMAKYISFRIECPLERTNKSITKQLTRVVPEIDAPLVKSIIFYYNSYNWIITVELQLDSYYTKIEHLIRDVDEHLLLHFFYKMIKYQFPIELYY